MIKQELLEFCSFLLIRDEISINKLKPLNFPPDLYNSIIGNWDHYVYYHEFEKVFAQKYENKESPYQGEWRKNGAINGQRDILWVLSNGIDFLTGQKFIDIYKQNNPDGLDPDKLNRMKVTELEEAVMDYIVRHHYKTDLITDVRNLDCQVSAVVLMWREFENELHNTIYDNPEMGEIYANKLENNIKQLLQGRAPKSWNIRYQNEFNNLVRNGENSLGIKILFYSNFI